MNGKTYQKNALRGTTLMQLVLAINISSKRPRRIRRTTLHRTLSHPQPAQTPNCYLLCQSWSLAFVPNRSFQHTLQTPNLLPLRSRLNLEELGPQFRGCLLLPTYHLQRNRHLSCPTAKSVVGGADSADASLGGLSNHNTGRIPQALYLKPPRLIVRLLLVQRPHHSHCTDWQAQIVSRHWWLLL